MYIKRSCQIDYSAVIGRNVKFAHPIGIVIGKNVIIGNNVKIWQNVTFGSHGKNALKKNYPVIKDNVRIFAGAKIIGGITIGENATIGANSVVNIDVPANATAVGIPCKILVK
ncbi:hypothetical protein DDT91_20660 [Algoriphagus sp. AK58]|nr:hypothetical protein [Algoriphagus sp. AK58]